MPTIKNNETNEIKIRMKYFAIILGLMLSFNCVAQDTAWYPYKSELGKWTFLSNKGDALNAVWYDSIEPFRSKLAFVMSNQKWGVIDKMENYVLPMAYDSIQIVGVSSYGGGYLKAGIKDPDSTYKFGLFRFSGEEVLPINCDYFN